MESGPENKSDETKYFEEVLAKVKEIVAKPQYSDLESFTTLQIKYLELAASIKQKHAEFREKIKKADRISEENEELLALTTEIMAAEKELSDLDNQKRTKMVELKGDGSFKLQALLIELESAGNTIKEKYSL